MAYVDELAKALRHEDPEVRVRVANALKELESPRATIPLIETLEDPCEEVRSAAALALSWVGDRRAVGPIYGALTDEDTQVRSAARFYLREAFGINYPAT